jgi:hypothetical protein
MKTFQQFFEEPYVTTVTRQNSPAVTQKRLEQQKVSALENQDRQRREREQREAENKNRQKETRLRSLEQQIQSIRAQ